MSCLHEFPIDVLKIDRSFIDNVKQIHDYAALLQAILALADNLGLQVVSEGIEDTEQLATLQALGCEYGQGYFFSKPLPSEDLVKYVCARHEQISIKTPQVPTGVMLNTPTNTV